jgi:hypothetical protein
MVVSWQELAETFEREATAHAAVVHGPVALAGVVALVGLASALAGAKNRTLRWGTMLAGAALLLSAWAANVTGQAAFDAMGNPPAEARALAERHEELGEGALWWSLGIAVLAAAPLARKRWVAVTGAWAATLAAGGLSYWIASTAHLGGRLVYDYGIGTPKPVTEQDLAPAEDPIAAIAWDPRAEFFRAEVRPVLAQYCFSCHGSQLRPAGGLSLVTAQGMLSGGDSGPAVLPGDAEASLLFRAISGEHPELTMPPGPRQPSERDVELIRRWIDEGAVWAPEAEAAGD